MSRGRRARNKARAAEAAQVQITDKFHANRSKCERVSCGARRNKGDRHPLCGRMRAGLGPLSRSRPSLKFRARH
jgi:hypothetical protein